MINDALRYMGISNPSGEIEMIKKVEETFSHIEKWIQPKSVQGIFDLEKDGRITKLKNTLCTIESKDLARLLQNCDRGIIIAATLGINVDQEIMNRQRKSMLDAVVLDACCSVIIDKVCDDIEAQLMLQLKENEFLTMRFSPGYGDVPLEVSSNILSILNANKRIGLMQINSGMLVPTKSITAIIGISHERENRQKNCGTCNLVKSCMYRKRGDRCGL